MNCPKCNADTMVLESRRKVDMIHRRRKCLECGYRFNTDEILTDAHRSLSLAALDSEEKIDKVMKLLKEQLYAAL
jgi:transcriptional regulator NrdR family protein